MFHTFGDSHCFNGWKFSNKIKTNHIGPLLCYSFANENLNRINISESKYNVKNNDFVCFCLGEIDCRCHIHKHISSEKSYQNIIDEIIKKYFDAVYINQKLFKNINICVYSVPPPIQKFNTREAPGHPFLGTDEERKSYVLYFNDQLKLFCQKYNYIFIDVYEYYIDKNGFLDKNLSDGNVHIRNPSGIKKVLKDKIKEIPDFQNF